MSIHIQDKDGELRRLSKEIAEKLNKSQSTVVFSVPKAIRAIIVSAYNKMESMEAENIKDLDNIFK